jgi:hypothetical protein
MSEDNYIRVHESDFVYLNQVETGAVPEGRIQLVNDKKGDVIVNLFYGLNKFEEEKNVYEYKMDFGALLNMADMFVEGKDFTKELHSYLNSEPEIIFPANSPAGDEAGRTYSMLERTILTNDRNIEAFISPSYGTVTRFAKSGGTCMEIYLQDCPKNDFAEKKYEKALRERAEEMKISVIIHRCDLEELPDKYYFFGTNGHLLHRKGYRGIGIEFNPIAGKTFGIALLDAVDKGSYYDVEYIKSRKKVKFKYLKVPSAFRIHAHTYMLANNVATTSISNVFNVVVSRLPNFRIAMKEGTNDYDFICPERSVTCCMVKRQREAVESVMYEMDFCKHGTAVDVSSPALEISSRRKICSIWNLMNSKYGCQYEDTYMVSSSVRAVYKCYSSLDKDAVYFDMFTVDIPTAWMLDSKGAYLRAYPEAVNISGVWYSAGKKIERSEYFNSELRFEIDPGRYYQSGKDETNIYYPGGSHFKFRKSSPINICITGKRVTYDKMLNPNKTMLTLENYVPGVAYVYSGVNATTVKKEIYRNPGNHFIGDGLANYVYSNPTNYQASLVPYNMTGDLFATRIGFDAYTIPKMDSTNRFYRDAIVIDDGDDENLARFDDFNDGGSLFATSNLSNDITKKGLTMADLDKYSPIASSFIDSDSNYLPKSGKYTLRGKYDDDIGIPAKLYNLEDEIGDRNYANHRTPDPQWLKQHEEFSKAQVEEAKQISINEYVNEPPPGLEYSGDNFASYDDTFSHEFGVGFDSDKFEGSSSMKWISKKGY